MDPKVKLSLWWIIVVINISYWWRIRGCCRRVRRAIITIHTDASRFLGQSFDVVALKLEAFIVAEQHMSGTYHTHGLLRSAVQDEARAGEILSALESSA